MGWNSKLASQFVRNSPLFADNADYTETMAVWFICYSNLSKTRPVEIEHVNNILEGGDIIDEYNPYANPGCKIPLQDRITFVKDETGEYKFYGLYTLIESSDNYTKRKFKRIKTYFEQ